MEVDLLVGPLRHRIAVRVNPSYVDFGILVQVSMSFHELALTTLVKIYKVGS